MIRTSQRPLTGRTPVREPEVRLGRRPGRPSDTVRRYRRTEHGTMEAYDAPALYRGQPAVTIAFELNGRSSTITFECPDELTKFAYEVMDAAEWLIEQRGDAP